MTVSGSGSHPFLNDPLITIGSLKLSGGATLTVPKQGAAVQTLRIVKEDGLRIEDLNTKLIIKGSIVELTGGGDVMIEDNDRENTTVIVFEDVSDGRLVFGGAKSYTIVRATAQSGSTTTYDLIRADGVHAFIEGGSGGDEVVMLFEGRIKGNLTITAQLINCGEVINDDDDSAKPLKLCDRPKMGSGLWRAGTEVDSSTVVSGRIIANAPVVGDSCSDVNVALGAFDVNSFWISAGQLEMHQQRSSTDAPTQLKVAYGKIMQFGRKIYCPCDPT